MQITVKLFAGLRERAGAGGVVLELPVDATVADAVAAASRATPSSWQAPSVLMLAVNNEYVQPDAALADGDELALIPPVSGG